MMKVHELNNMLAFVNNGYGFKAKLDNGKADSISLFRKIDTFGLGKGWTLRSKKGEELADSFVKAALNYNSTWTIDGLPVQILKSGAGYYAGCFDYGPFGGPYCRVSEYFDTKVECAAWMWHNDPTRKEEHLSKIDKIKEDPIYVIVAQIGNEEDYGWEEVGRTMSIDEARDAYRKGARIYEDFKDGNLGIECIFDVTPEEDCFELPF